MDNSKTQGHTTENVKKYMDLIENITNSGEYEDFVDALLIYERSDLTKDDINEEIVNRVQKITGRCDTIISDYINERLIDAGVSFDSKTEMDKTDDLEPEI